MLLLMLLCLLQLLLLKDVGPHGFVQGRSRTTARSTTLSGTKRFDQELNPRCVLAHIRRKDGRKSGGGRWRTVVVVVGRRRRRSGRTCSRCGRTIACSGTTSSSSNRNDRSRIGIVVCSIAVRRRCCFRLHRDGRGLLFLRRLSTG